MVSDELIEMTSFLTYIRALTHTLTVALFMTGPGLDCTELDR
jgi:hypothetical protein